MQGAVRRSCKQAALGVHGAWYSRATIFRVDFRVAPDGSFRLLEFNVTCNLATTMSMNIGAGAAGVSHEAMIEHFLCYSMQRQGVLVGMRLLVILNAAFLCAFAVTMALMILLNQQKFGDILRGLDDSRVSVVTLDTSRRLRQAVDLGLPLKDIAESRAIVDALIQDYPELQSVSIFDAGGHLLVHGGNELDSGRNEAPAVWTSDNRAAEGGGLAHRRPGVVHRRRTGNQQFQEARRRGSGPLQQGTLRQHRCGPDE